MSKPSEKAMRLVDAVEHELIAFEVRQEARAKAASLIDAHTAETLAERQRILDEQYAQRDRSFTEHKRVLDECESALAWLADMATGSEQYAKEAGFKYTGDHLCMSEIPTHCPTLGDLRKCRKALAAIAELKTNEKPNG